MVNRLLPLFLLPIFLFSCGSPETDTPEQDPPVPETREVNLPNQDLSEDILDKFPQIEGSKQLIVVAAATTTSTTAKMSAYEKQEGSWVVLRENIPVNIGKAGFAPFGEKREGDGKAPSGLFLLGPAFGYTNDLKTSMEFITLDDSHYWMSDPDSSNYNQLIRYKPGTKEMEKMRRADDLYSYGLIVQYNTDPVVPGAGSAIFMHVERGPGKPTLGCVSMEPKEMKALIEWLDPNAYPLILMGTESYIH
ncbi:MAG: L,D-transpeptidase family protein [Bacteroidetes bacterium]|nr:L,D-transpeptidase family protein [Bacteroidota bacterium]